MYIQVSSALEYGTARLPVMQERVLHNQLLYAAKIDV